MKIFATEYVSDGMKMDIKLLNDELKNYHKEKEKECIEIENKFKIKLILKQQVKL